jgi:hypothetical protein
MLMERHVDGNSQNSKLIQQHHITTVLLSMPPTHSDFEQGLFIASIGKTMTSKDGERTSDLVADASDTEAESVNLREVVDR